MGFWSSEVNNELKGNEFANHIKYLEVQSYSSCGFTEDIGARLWPAPKFGPPYGYEKNVFRKFMLKATSSVMS